MAFFRLVSLASLCLLAASCNKPTGPEDGIVESNVRVLRHCGSTSIFEVKGRPMMLDSNTKYIELTPEALADICGSAK